MSDKASIFLRFNLVDESKDEIIKGIIGNHYRGFDPLGLITRAMYGAIGFVAGRKYVQNKSSYNDFEQSKIYQSFRRTFDVDYIHRYLSISVDSAEWIKNRYRMGKVSEEEAGFEFFWCDTDFGQIVFDVTGTLHGEVKLKYAIVDNLHLLSNKGEEGSHIKIMSIDDYMEDFSDHFKEYEDEESECFELMNTFLEKAELLTKAELIEYFNTPLTEYLQLKEPEKEIDFRKNTVDVSRDKNPKEVLIERLGLSVRSYNCLKRAGVNTVADIIELYNNNTLSTVRNLNDKCCSEIIQDIQIWI